MESPMLTNGLSQLSVCAAAVLVLLLWGCPESGVGVNHEVGCEDGNIAGEYICEDGEWVEYDGPCSGVDCSNHGDCVEEDDEAVCECDDGYVADGLDCVEQNGGDTSCGGSDCGPHGHCLVDGDIEFCHCDDGYTGVGQDFECVPEDDSDPCEFIDCNFNGDCLVDTDGDPYCDCDDGYISQGLSCVEEPGPCDDVNCGPNGDCVEVSDDDYECDCDAGYEYDPNNDYCVDEQNPCDGVDCGPHGSCQPVGDDPSCSCDAGYKPENLYCVPDVACHNVSDSCSVYILSETSDTFTEVDYADTELGDELDEPVVAAFGLEDTDRAYLITENSYYQINSVDFSVQTTGPLSDIHPDLEDGPQISAAHAVPERFPGQNQGDGNDGLAFISHQSTDGDIQAITFDYNFSEQSFQYVQGWYSGEWEEQPAMNNKIPSADEPFLGQWIDDENHRDLMVGSPAEACDDEDAPDSSAGLPYAAAMTTEAVHYSAATHCFPWVTKKSHLTADITTTYDPDDVVTYQDVGAVFYHNRSLYLLTKGYYD